MIKSQYAMLDALIIDRLEDKGSIAVPLMYLDGGTVRKKSMRLAELTGREAFRILDGRIQFLRKHGIIEFKHGSGWKLC